MKKTLSARIEHADTIEMKRDAFRSIKKRTIESTSHFYGMKALLWGTRYDEIRSIAHGCKVEKIHKHPLFHFSQGDVWKYIKTHDLSVADVYNDGARTGVSFQTI